MTKSEDVTNVLNDFDCVMKDYDNLINDYSDNIWQGEAKTNIIESANEFLTQYRNPTFNQLKDLAEALTYLEAYNVIIDDIKKYQNIIDSSADDKNETYLKICQNTLNNLISKKNSYAKLINTLLEEICFYKISNDSMISSGFDLSNYDIDSLLNNNNLRKLGENENLSDFYEDGYIEKVLEDIKNDTTLSGREKAVASALTLIKLAADKGVKLDYDYGGAHVNDVDTSDILQGADCSSFVTYILNQGSKEKIGMMSTGTIQNNYSKYTIDYENAKPGDLLNCYNNSIQHVEFIVENHPEEGYFITAEARGSNYGIVLSKTYYKDCKKQGQATYNMDCVY